MLVGTISTLALIYLSPTIQIDILQRETALFPLKNPAVISIPLSFLVGFVVSKLSRDPVAEERFAQVERQIHLGARA